MADPAPHFVIKNRFQKGATTYRDLLSDAVLADICRQLTGRGDYTVDFDDEGYNIGRLAMLYYRKETIYVSIAETKVTGRNSSFQSIPSALSRYVLDPSPRKRMAYYVHAATQGDINTPYFIFMYRLLATAGVQLLNLGPHVSRPTSPFSAPEDIIGARNALRERSRGNRSTYVTQDENGTVQVYGKTYGASKYETTLICLALLKIMHGMIEVFQVSEGGLTELPATSRTAIEAAGSVDLRISNHAIEAQEFKENDSLRSARYIYNLLERYDAKSCAFCDCRIPQIIHGAHIWPVASIKATTLTFEQQLACALDGSNGLWLCENHHKLFDSGLIHLHESGALLYRSQLSAAEVAFLKRVTTIRRLDGAVLDAGFLGYLSKRNSGVDTNGYSPL